MTVPKLTAKQEEYLFLAVMYVGGAQHAWKLAGKPSEPDEARDWKKFGDALIKIKMDFDAARYPDHWAHISYAEAKSRVHSAAIGFIGNRVDYYGFWKHLAFILEQGLK